MKRLIILALVLSACATGSAIVTGRARPATSAAEVEVLLAAPRRYEAIALITAKTSSSWTQAGGQARALEELREQAASVGANALILTGASEGERGLFTGGTQALQGTAIFVLR